MSKSSFLEKVKWFQELLSNINNCLLLIICLHRVKCFQVLVCNRNNLTPVIYLHTFK